jgi:integrase/recombinase XerD
VERKSPLTASTYKQEILCFFDYLESHNLDAAGLDPSQLSGYLDKRKTQDAVNSRTISKAIACLRSFYRFMVDSGLCADNPALVLEPPRRSLTLPRVLGRDKLDALLNMADNGTPLGLRNRAIYELMYSAGLRVSEAVRLNIRDIDLNENTARVRGKGGKERMVIFGAEAAGWVLRYQAESRPALERGGARGRNNPALFIGRTGRRLSRKGIWKNYSRIAALAGTETRLHNLRHSFATDMLSGGADLRTVQELLGHADIATTQIYTHVDASRLRNSHRQYMPRLNERSGK